MQSVGETICCVLIPIRHCILLPITKMNRLSGGTVGHVTCCAGKKDCNTLSQVQLHHAVCLHLGVFRSRTMAEYLCVCLYVGSVGSDCVGDARRKGHVSLCVFCEQSSVCVFIGSTDCVWECVCPAPWCSRICGMFWNASSGLKLSPYY